MLPQSGPIISNLGVDTLQPTCFGQSKKCFYVFKRLTPPPKKIKE